MVYTNRFGWSGIQPPVVGVGGSFLFLLIGGAPGSALKQTVFPEDIKYCFTSTFGCRDVPLTGQQTTLQ